MSRLAQQGHSQASHIVTIALNLTFPSNDAWEHSTPKIFGRYTSGGVQANISLLNSIKQFGTQGRIRLGGRLCLVLTDNWGQQ